MSADVKHSPANLAAQHAMDQLVSCLENKRSFVFEAGAGAGKTYSLIQSLHYLIRERGSELKRCDQKIACITYTNVAKDEIKSRTEGHPLVISETIHSFCWALMANFQGHLRALLPTLERWQERIDNSGEIGTKPIEYDLGYPKIEEGRLSLGHDDVLALMVKLMKERKFRLIVSSRFPIIFIDEYQDTNKDLANAFLEFFINTGEGPLIGFFGDSWQKIYGAQSCGKLESPCLDFIGKKANFRSERIIVESLNRIREDLPQNCADTSSSGSVSIFHTNGWTGQRRTESHWKGDLPAPVAHSYLLMTRDRLLENGWDFSPEKTKTLMLTHNLLASEQGYLTLANVFSRTEAFIKKEDAYISFFVDLVEPICAAFENRHYGQLSSILNGKMPYIRHYQDKAKWADALKTLVSLRESATIGEVIDFLKTVERPRLSTGVDRDERSYLRLSNIPETDRTDEQKEFLTRIERLKAVDYQEVIALSKYIEEKTPFATKHSVKGAEFENVLVVCGRGWNQYNFDQMLTWVCNGIPSGREETFDRNRNLFYVACSRPKKRLALLFTQELASTSLGILGKWFGHESIYALPTID